MNPALFVSVKGVTKKAPGIPHGQELMAVVIVIVPITVAVPAVAVFIPPTMALSPAAFPRLMQFMPRMVRLSAVPTMMLDGFMQLVICLGDASLAPIVVIVATECARHRTESQHCSKRGSGEHHPAEYLSPLSVKLHVLHLPFFAPTGMGLGPDV
jgi:hypothetical protein